jgi:hypothetical protein
MFDERPTLPFSGIHIRVRYVEKSHYFRLNVGSHPRLQRNPEMLNGGEAIKVDVHHWLYFFL